MTGLFDIFHYYFVQGQNDLITEVKQAEAKLGCSIKLRQIDAKLRQIEANAAKLRQMRPNLGELRQIEAN